MLAEDGASRAGPPATPEHDVVEDYHGRQVHDPYRWLEQKGAAAVEQWIDAQNAYTDVVMSSFRDHGAIIEEASAICFANGRRQRTIAKRGSGTLAEALDRFGGRKSSDGWFGATRVGSS